MQERRYRVYEMAADSVGGQLLIGMAAAKTLPSDILPYVEERIFKNPSAVVRVQASNYFKRPGTKTIYSISRISKLTANEAKGKVVFTGSCASCHKHGNAGNTIGPELTVIGKKFDNTGLLDAIINPSAAIVFGYEPWLVNTKDGNSVFGFLLAENPESITIKDIGGTQHNIFTKNISAKQQQNKSLMPEPDQMGLTEQDLANLSLFLLKNQ